MADYAPAARKPKKDAYLLAKADAMKPPTIDLSSVAEYHEGHVDEPIIVYTDDLFRVQTLRITIRDAAGDVVETGDATRRNKDFLSGSSATRAARRSRSRRARRAGRG